MLEKCYADSYAPLILDCFQEAKKLQTEQLENQAAPCLPVFGAGYEKAPLRIAIVGKAMLPRTTLAAFVAAEQTAPGELPGKTLAMFRSMSFLKDQPVPMHNVSFVLGLAARLNGRRHKWNALPCNILRKLLDQIAWAEWTPAEETQPAPKPESAFCRFRHLQKALQPDLTIVTAIDPGERYAFDGCQAEIISCVYQMTHYLVKPQKTHVIVMPPPGKINPYDMEALVSEEIPNLLEARRIPVLFPEFARAADEGETILTDLTKRLPPGTPLFDKHAAVAWLAAELEKMDAILSFTAVMNLLAAGNYTTSRNKKLTTQIRGGSNKLIRCTAERLRDAGKAALADSVTTRILTLDFDTV